MFKRFLKQFFCLHDCEVEYCEYSDVITYTCKKCGHKVMYTEGEW